MTIPREEDGANAVLDDQVSGALAHPTIAQTGQGRLGQYQERCVVSPRREELADLPSSNALPGNAIGEPEGQATLQAIEGGTWYQTLEEIAKPKTARS